MLASFHLPMPCRAACSHQPSVFRSGHLRVPLLKASLCTPSMLSSSRSTFAGAMLFATRPWWPATVVSYAYSV